MKLSEYQEWAEKGKPLNDAAQGLLFEAIQLAEQTNAEDKAISILLEVAQTAAILHLADNVQRLEFLLKDLV